MKVSTPEKLRCSQCHRKFLSHDFLFECHCGALNCNDCLSDAASSFHIHGKCLACTREKDFLLSLSGEALSGIWQNRFSKFSMNGGKNES